MAPELVLQPGSVVSAQVLKVLSADLVRIAIASLSIDVASEIPLQQGQNLQLAVTQTKDGIRLAVVGQGSDAASASADAVTLSQEALIDVPANAPTTVAPKNILTPVERAATATNQAFGALKIRQTKSQAEQEDDGEKREIEGAAGDREVNVTLKVEGKNSTRVQVVAKRTAVTWDKDFARSVLDKIVAYSH